MAEDMPEDIPENVPESGHRDPAGDAGEDRAAEEKLVRRAFFLEGFRGLLRPLADILEARFEHVRRSIDASRLGAFDDDGSGPGSGAGEMEPEASRLLRPPGAIKEELFTERCQRSGRCLAACPVQAIQVLQIEDGLLNGTPYIDPQLQACVVCDSLACMQACPSGALQNVPRNLIQIGLAELRRDTCLRSNGDDCQICVEKCPIGPTAIEIPYHGADVEVKKEGCVGCGVCELYCPTRPRAIVIRPL